MRNKTMLNAFTKAKVAKSASPKFVSRLVNALHRASAPKRKPAAKGR